MNHFTIPQHSVIIGGVIDDARTRWLDAENQAAAADRARIGSTDPELNRRAAAMRAIADRLKGELEIATEAANEAVRAARARQVHKIVKDQAEAKGSLLGTVGRVAILASPLVVAAILIRRL